MFGRVEKDKCAKSKSAKRTHVIGALEKLIGIVGIQRKQLPGGMVVGVMNAG
jgi:hypothetical protein